MTASGILKTTNQRTFELYLNAGTIEYWQAIYGINNHKGITYLFILKDGKNKKQKNSNDT